MSELDLSSVYVKSDWDSDAVLCETIEVTPTHLVVKDSRGKVKHLDRQLEQSGIDVATDFIYGHVYFMGWYLAGSIKPDPAGWEKSGY